MKAAPSGSALYLDTSCLLKLFFLEPESARVIAVLADERRVLVSELGRLEAETQLRARLHGGLLSRSRYRQLSSALTRTLALEPFAVLEFPADGFERARSLAARVSVHCRTLDLLHMAVMDAHELGRLFTNDAGQAGIARALGISVVAAPDQ